jgi:hypothetical protein
VAWTAEDHNLIGSFLNGFSLLVRRANIERNDPAITLAGQAFVSNA